MPTITVEIDCEASVTVSVAGVTGPACKELTRQLEAELGETRNDSPTHEMLQHRPVPLRQSRPL